MRDLVPIFEKLLAGELPALELTEALSALVLAAGPDAIGEALRELQARGVYPGAGWKAALLEVQARGLLPEGGPYGPA